MFVSFVIPAYNVEKYIVRTLKSVLSQTDMDLEVIVVNDGSTDRTEQVAHEILSKSGFNRYKIITKENGGPGSARNRGLKEAQGQYVIFLDGDDYVVPTLVEELKKAMVTVTEKIDVFCWRYLKVDESGTVLASQPQFRLEVTYVLFDGPTTLQKALIEGELWTSTVNLAYSRQFLASWNLSYNEKYRFSEDYEFEWKVFLKKPMVLVINKVLSFYVQRSGSITKSKDADFERLASYLAIRELYGGLCDDPSTKEELKQAILEQAVLQFVYFLLHLRKSMEKPFASLFKELQQEYPHILDQVSDDVRSLLTKPPSKISWKKRAFFMLFRSCPSLSAELWYQYSKFKTFARRIMLTR